MVMLFQTSFQSQIGLNKAVLWPKISAIFFIMMFREAKENITEGIFFCFQTDGSLFNLHCLLAPTKTTGELILELQFADDCAPLGHTKEALQHIVDSISEAAKAFGLTISLKKD